MFETLSLYLQPYKELIGSAASFVTVGQFLSGAFICKDVYKKGSTDGIPSNPFVGGFVMYDIFLIFFFFYIIQHIFIIVDY